MDDDRAEVIESPQPSHDLAAWQPDPADPDDWARGFEDDRPGRRYSEGWEGLRPPPASSDPAV